MRKRTEGPGRHTHIRTDPHEERRRQLSHWKHFEFSQVCHQQYVWHTYQRHRQKPCCGLAGRVWEPTTAHTSVQTFHGIKPVGWPTSWQAVCELAIVASSLCLGFGAVLPRGFRACFLDRVGVWLTAGTLAGHLAHPRAAFKWPAPGGRPPGEVAGQGVSEETLVFHDLRTTPVQ